MSRVGSKPAVFMPQCHTSQRAHMPTRAHLPHVVQRLWLMEQASGPTANGQGDTHRTRAVGAKRGGPDVCIKPGWVCSTCRLQRLGRAVAILPYSCIQLILFLRGKKVAKIVHVIFRLHWGFASRVSRDPLTAPHAPNHMRMELVT